MKNQANMTGDSCCICNRTKAVCPPTSTCGVQEAGCACGTTCICGPACPGDGCTRGCNAN